MKRIAYHKVLRNKDASSYSAKDLASIVMGSAYPTTAPDIDTAVAVHASAPAPDESTVAGIKRRRRALSDASVASVISVRSTRSATVAAKAASASTGHVSSAGSRSIASKDMVAKREAKAAKAARKELRQARREAKAERALRKRAKASLETAE